MKRRIITLGLLASVMLTSCVDDNESTAVQAQRNAVAEKLQAEADIAKVNAAIAQAGLTDKVSATELEKKKALLDAQMALEEFNHEIDKRKNQLAQDKEDYKGTIDEKKIANLEKKYTDYTDAVLELEGKKLEKITKDNELVDLENGLVDAKESKEKDIADNTVTIEAKKDLIEELKTFEQYKGNQTELDLAKEKAINDSEKATNDAKLAMDALDKAMKATEKIEDKLKVDELEFFKSLKELSDVDADLVDGNITAVPTSDDEGKIEDGDYRASYKMYDETKLPSIDSDQLSIKRSELKAGLKPQEEAIDDAKKSLDTAKKEYEKAKTAWRAVENDPTNADYDSKKSDYDNAEKAFEVAKKVVEDAEKALEDAKSDLVKINDLVTLIESSEAEVKTLITEFNTASKTVAEKDIASQKAGDAKDAAKEVEDAATKVADDSSSIADQIKDAEDKIKELERENIDLESISTTEEAIELKKAQIAKVEGEISNLEAKVKTTKAAYEEAKNALK